MMQRVASWKCLAFIFLMFAFSVTVFYPTKLYAAKRYPLKPITWVVPFGPGGASDRFARALTKAAESVDPSVHFVVINVPGAQTIAGLTYLLQAEADGYTIYGATTDLPFNAATGRLKISLDEIVPVARIQQDVDMWFIRADDHRFSNLDELVAYAKEHPGVLRIGTTGTDGSDAYSIREVEDHFGIKLTNVPFDNPGERYAALVGGIVDILFEQPGDMRGFLDAGQVKPILTMTESRLSRFPMVPSTGELGIPLSRGYWRGAVMRKGVPTEAITFLQDLFRKAVETPEYRRYEEEAYLNLREGFMPAEEFGAFIHKEYQEFKKLYLRRNKCGDFGWQKNSCMK